MTEQTPETPAERNRRNGYLPVLPDGWEYTVQIVGPGGRVSVYANEGGRGGPWVVQVQPTGGTSRTLPAESLADGVRQAADAVKVLNRLAKVETEYQAARKAALAAFGPDETPEDDTPTVGPVTSAGELTKHDDDGRVSMNADDVAAADQ
jgi:hypothetical protein